MSNICKRMPAKKVAGKPTPENLIAMIRETCVAECVHGNLNITGLGCFLLWDSAWCAAVYGAYVLLGNLPFMLLQQHNPGSEEQGIFLLTSMIDLRYNSIRGRKVHCMRITLENGFLRLTVDTLGAQMMSIRDAGGCEYLWQGDPKYWADRAPTLFPFIGRLTNNSYRFHGRTYPMGIHGFAAAMQFSPVEQGKDRLVLNLCSSITTLTRYPFDFSLLITYQLRGSRIEICYNVENRSDQTMPFGIGGHPGFRVPLEDGKRFEDYYLEFSQACLPDRVGFTPAVYLSGRDLPYPLEDGRRLELTHSLFDEDAVILKNMAREVTLRSTGSRRAVTVSYPDMPYLGIWHQPGTDAPYVCIEPWTSLPARQDVVEELSCKSDMIQLAPGRTYENRWFITVRNDER